jgi:hypothetical protein
LGHGEDEPEVGKRLLELAELVEEGRRGAVAVRVDQRHAVGKPLLVDVAEHAAKDGDPDSPGDEDERSSRIFGKPE